MTADIARWLPTLIGLLSGPAGAGIIVAWWKHRERTRAQTDEVALDLVKQLQERVTEVETTAAARIDAVEKAAAQERLLCDAKLETADHKLSVLRHELGNVESSLDGLLLAIQFAPPDKVPEIVEVAQARRSERARLRREAQEAKGETRQRAQIEISARRVSDGE